MLLAVAGAFDTGLGFCIRAISDGVNSAAPVSKVFFIDINIYNGDDSRDLDSS